MFAPLDDVTMPTVDGSRGWIKSLKTDRYGEPAAVVVWEHHNGVRSTIPLRKLARLENEDN